MNEALYGNSQRFTDMIALLALRNFKKLNCTRFATVNAGRHIVTVFDELRKVQ
ncbi:hypothetical protein KIN20_015042 [Parelaphostrongylus tenuis]|uniref:Uncharacterized protein n=1 Tax=Parelaphostrongylus tenuis TaxID=148309 RepID=A0AAD5QPP0_PARTN|nr:hypothetical protein KIN20_015042 [Parelaphostrongylus tenuis]